MSADAILAAQQRLEALRARAPRVHFEAAPKPRSLPTLAEAIGAALETRQWVSDEEVARYEAERDHENRLRRLRDLGFEGRLPKAMVRALATDRLEPTAALDTVRRWVAYASGPQARGPRPILALIGAMGRGKTVAAAWLALSESARYVEAEELSRLSVARFGEERLAWERLCAARALIVDEVGTEDDRARARAAYRSLLNQRHDRLTLLCGNLNRAELRALLDERTVDRVREMGVVVELEGESMRRGDAL